MAGNAYCATSLIVELTGKAAARVNSADRRDAIEQGVGSSLARRRLCPSAQWSRTRSRLNPLYRRRRYAFAPSPHQTINNRNRQPPSRKTRFVVEPADEPDLAVLESANGCGKRKAQTFHRSST